MAAAGGAPGGLASSSLSGAQVLGLLGERARPRRAAAAAAAAVRYDCEVDVEGSPWLQLCEWAVSRLYPAASSSERGVLCSALCHSLAGSTASQYMSTLRLFAEF